MAKCYIAEGADVPEFAACNTTASVSLCCLSGQICLSNGLCSTQYGQIYSGACTDPTYSSSICPEFCTMATGGHITQCEGSAGQNGRYCCSMGTNGTCCDDPHNKLHMAPPILSAIAMMPGIARANASSTRVTTSSTSLLASSTASSTLQSTETSLNDTLSTTANTPTTELAPTSNGKMKKLALGLGVGLGVVVLALLLLGIYKFHRRREGRERYHRSLARARIDAYNTAKRAHNRRGVGTSAESVKTESVPTGVHTLASSEAIPSIARTLASSEAANTRVQTVATSEAVPTIARTLAASESIAGSRPASRLPTALPNSPIELVEMNNDSPTDAEATPELGLDTSESDTFESDTSESQQHNASVRSNPAASAQSDRTSTQSLNFDMLTARVPTLNEGSKSREPPRDESTSPRKPAESLQVENEVERQWSWQQGDDEHMQRSLDEQMGLDEQVRQNPEE